MRFWLSTGEGEITLVVRHNFFILTQIFMSINSLYRGEWHPSETAHFPRTLWHTLLGGQNALGVPHHKGILSLGGMGGQWARLCRTTRVRVSPPSPVPYYHPPCRTLLHVCTTNSTIYMTELGSIE